MSRDGYQNLIFPHSAVISRQGYRWLMFVLPLVVWHGVGRLDAAFALQPPAPAEAANSPSSVETEAIEGVNGANADEQSLPIPDTWKRLGKNEIWIDFSDKSVIVAGHICLTEGGLEMFACPRNTKEHESVISVNASSSEVHAALVALGANPGQPVQWDPEYKPATGPTIRVRVRWIDPSTGRPITRWAKEMVREYASGQGLAHDWVFGGSMQEVDPETGVVYYFGDGGEMLCLSNFSSATMDLNVPSSNANFDLLFEAYTENIPPRGTKVYIIMQPIAPEEVLDK